MSNYIYHNVQLHISKCSITHIKMSNYTYQNVQLHLSKCESLSLYELIT